MATPVEHIRGQLLNRRDRLEAATTSVGETDHLLRLLRDVDAALEQTRSGTYGLCEICHGEIEPERLLADPLVRTCLDHLSPTEVRALEQDLDLASRVQRELLPARHLKADGWEIAYHYEPAGLVSGDYCDVLRPAADGELVFLVGDISGKGVAASMLMAHLHASFRTLMGLCLPMNEILARANRVFCDSTMSSHYATLVCGRLDPAGTVEIANAGHCAPLFTAGGEVTSIEATGLPVGMFCTTQYPVRTLRLDAGDTLLLYTDGLTEARNPADEEFGVERLHVLVAERYTLSPQQLLGACLDSLASFRGDAQRLDDLTVMAIRRTE